MQFNSNYAFNSDHIVIISLHYCRFICEGGLLNVFYFQYPNQHQNGKLLQLSKENLKL